MLIKLFIIASQLSLSYYNLYRSSFCSSQKSFWSQIISSEVQSFMFGTVDKDTNYVKTTKRSVSQLL
jgi:hypothetical protein